MQITQQEYEERMNRYRKLKEIGIDVAQIDGNEGMRENPYRLEAMLMIHRGKDVPKELKDKIKKFDKRYNRKC